MRWREWKTEPETRPDLAGLLPREEVEKVVYVRAVRLKLPHMTTEQILEDNLCARSSEEAHPN